MNAREMEERIAWYRSTYEAQPTPDAKMLQQVNHLKESLKDKEEEIKDLMKIVESTEQSYSAVIKRSQEQADAIYMSIIMELIARLDNRYD